ncbi:MAG: hypothetical protein IPP30_10980 [Flavobacterium sp.]|nr:hypothetical protein [Flavobacterium sp.]
MKKIFFLPVVFAVILSFAGCEKDESLDPLPLLVQGQFMRLDITRDRIDANNLETSSFGGMLTNPSNDVVRYELLVRLVRADRGISEYIPLETLTSFPQDLSITAQKVEDAYERVGTSVTVQQGDVFRFIAYSYNSQGVRAAYRDLSATVRSEPGYKQAYKFNTSVEADLEQDVNNYQTAP